MREVRRALAEDRFEDFYRRFYQRRTEA